MGQELDGVFHPRSIAVVGASAEDENRGRSFVEALRYFEFPTVYAVHPKAQDVLGYKGYKSLLDVPGPVDYVISSVPTSVVLGLVDDCAKKGVKAIHFFTARFSETGTAEGTALEKELLKRAKAAGIRILGPNCMGLHYPGQRVSFMSFPKTPGNVAFLSQSGGNCHEVVFTASLRGVRFSKAVSYGNAIDINEAELMEYFAGDPETRIIGGYIEGVRDGPRFVRALREAAARKPVVLLKGGVTQAGTRAVASHTASLAGSKEVWEALVRQAGAVSVGSLQELVDMLVAFQFCKPGAGYRTGVIGGGGGRAVQSADQCEAAGLRVDPIPMALREEFRRRTGDMWGEWISNPADGSILQGSGIDEKVILELMGTSSGFDQVIVNLRELWTADSTDDAKRIMDLMKGYLALAAKVEKPVAVVTSDVAGWNSWQIEALLENRKAAIEARVAMFPSIGRAAKAMARRAGYYEQRQGL